ncbi:hypothetical protein BDW02DRAFT_386553 [Decorospora gaudefroyi]|uniref:Uncharacterized protein n=1 Tax=Decorospora gaudefroyi TaxID=184978 RepID=A0A6A5K6C5_9PLEO|nr:hypothetical protein BDW02DRAFT_386553 [Decorospora gaudefroyi]
MDGRPWLRTPTANSWLVELPARGCSWSRGKNDGDRSEERVLGAADWLCPLHRSLLPCRITPYDRQHTPSDN